MRDLVRRQDGVTLIEMLVGCVLMLAVMGTAFTALSQFEQTSSRNGRQNDSQEKARQAINLIVKRLRNDAAPTPGNPQGIDRANDHDLIFQSTDPAVLASGSQNTHNVMRVRYCLDASNPANGKVWLQEQRWTTAAGPPAPSSTSCPDAAWGSQRVLADHVVNRLGAVDRPVWTIDCPSGYAAAVCDGGTDPGMLARVKRIGMELFVDEAPAKSPGESRLSTAVFFRNQNARPVALVTPAAVQPVGGHVLANASLSTDPDSDRLFYRWCYYGTASPGSTWCANGIELPQRTVSIDYLAPPSDAGRTVTIGLRVQDPGGLVNYQNAQVTLP
jgi:Tfp pilus assembly protein PilV